MVTKTRPPQTPMTEPMVPSRLDELGPIFLDQQEGKLRYNRAHVRFLQESELLPESGYELLDGEIVPKMKNEPHQYSMRFLIRWLNRVFGEDFIRPESATEVALQDSLSNLPEPDASVTQEPFSRYYPNRPAPSDLRLVCEVSHTTQTNDYVKKARLYARAGIAEYWIVNVQKREVRIHRLPLPAEDKYDFVRDFTETERIASLAAPEAFVTITDLLPPFLP